MSGANVTICVMDENNVAVPFAVIPLIWVQEHQGASRFDIEVPNDPSIRRDRRGAASFVISATTIQTLAGPMKQVFIYCTYGAQHLLNHSQVATFPQGRLIIEGKLH